MDNRELIGQRDARMWAAIFVHKARRNPDLATDEDAMFAWFAAALETGYDLGYDRGVDYVLDAD